MPRPCGSKGRCGEGKGIGVPVSLAQARGLRATWRPLSEARADLRPPRLQGFCPRESVATL